MVTYPNNLTKIRLNEGRIVDMILTPWHRLCRETRFKQSACRRSVQVLRNQRIGLPNGIGLLSQQNLDTRRLAYMRQKAAVSNKRGLVNLIIGGFQSTFTGLKFSFHGKPCFGSSAINGSGSNSSHVYTPGFVHFPSRNIFAPIIAGTPVV